MRVLEKARELGYTRLRQRRSRPAAAATNGGAAGGAAIGAVIFGMEDTLVQLPVVSSGLQGIESTLSAHGRSLMIANIPKGDRVPPFLRDGSVAGVVLKGPNQGLLPSPDDNELVRAILAVPHVWLMGRPANATGDHCNFDTSAAGRLVVEHLHAKGHRRITFLNPKPGQIQFERVKASFIASASRLELEWSLLESDPASVLSWPLPAITSQEKVDALLDRWLAQPRATRATAFFVPSDRTAVQLYSSLARRGLAVAKDVSIVSCNNERSLLSNLHPGLTSIDIHADFIGRRAVDQLLWRIAHPMEPNTVQLLAEPTLVERESVATL
jgi:DNA-binding LacI/PurR family transcriptional regulator